MPIRDYGKSTTNDRFRVSIRWMSVLLLKDPSRAQALATAKPNFLTGRFLQNLDGLPPSWVDQDALLLR